MKCPICGARCSSDALRCPDCGASHVMINAGDFHTERRRFPAAVIRIIAAVAGFAVLGGLWYTWLSFRLSPIDPPLPEPLTPSLPAPTEQVTTKPAPEEGCFAIEDGAVTFLPDRWNGSPILNIPDTVDGQTVTSLETGCFRNCTGLTTVTLPETLTGIGPEAFSGCSELRGLFIPQGTQSIGENAFAGCVAMEAICIPASVTAIPKGVFDDCARLLYINYEGTFESWAALYDDFITPFTAVICADGSYYHGVRK